MINLYYNKANDRFIEVLPDGLAIVYERVGNSAPVEEEETKAPVKHRKGRPKKDKAGYGEKTQAVSELVDKGFAVKVIVEKLRGKFPTIVASDVYAIRSKLRKAQSSETFTGGKPPVEEGGKDGMIKKYGKTAVDKIIQLNDAGYLIGAIAHHHEVRLTNDQVEEVLAECGE